MVNMVKFEVNRRAQMATVYKITQKTPYNHSSK